ncbi:DUF2279 domain-containing protein [Mangrovimonas xylaniphaga]|uniref:DUF2279 domain-containing protein n=1 Tax=Mangrovimonas xylaniphaga TaxID=1645915 RepID=UPI000B2471BE|nr:DUF2279 domain-containing protein [Mangrovimonas xylaniphaga]
MKRGLTQIILFCFAVTASYAQTGINKFLKPSDTLNIKRRNAVVISEASLATMALIGLDQLWYADYPRSKFHTLNDNQEWLQMDKLGHVYTSYQMGRLGANTLQWSGVSERDQLLYGGTLGFAFLTAVEVFDGFSEEWGFSWGDVIANASGTGLYIGQELLWKEQRMTLKYSFHETHYAQLRPETLGDGFLEEILKDYNGQTYWLSINLHSFFKESKIPRWLNMAFGYGAEGMLFGSENENIEEIIEKNRRRQYFFSLDVDLTKINTNSHFLRTVFEVFNLIKIPFPTVEFTDKNCIKFHGIYF